MQTESGIYQKELDKLNEEVFKSSLFWKKEWKCAALEKLCYLKMLVSKWKHIVFVLNSIKSGCVA